MDENLSGETPNPDSLTAKLLQSLIARGWSQKRLSKRLGIPLGRISRWSRGIGTESCDDVLRIKDLSAKTRPRRVEHQPEADD